MFLLNIADALHVNSDQSIYANPSLVEIDSVRSQQAHERTIKCYATYFQGWCQAFGEHKNISVNDRAGCWLLSENQIGLVLTRPLFRQLNREIFFHGKTPTLVFDERGVHIGLFYFPITGKPENQVLGAIEQFFETGAVLHLFRTSHLLYGNGSRILTISSKRPKPIIYRETGTMNIRLQ